MFYFYSPTLPKNEKTQQILLFSDVFRGYRSGTLVENRLSNDFRIRKSNLPSCLEHVNVFCKKMHTLDASFCRIVRHDKYLKKCTIDYLNIYNIFWKESNF